MKHHSNEVKGQTIPSTRRERPGIPKFLLVFACFLSLSSYAQDKKAGIKGLIENEKGEALQGVSVQLASRDIKMSSVTNKDGIFSFGNPGIKGTYTLLVSHVGYVSQAIQKENFSPGKEESIHVILKED